ncbi:MAG TPA: GvpL/GvpF family gas vesicle protein [Chloroflexota bacterium]|nr:GvpL/GvpF family gas vesicle protein [Chloroflexota bacterium]
MTDRASHHKYVYAIVPASAKMPPDLRGLDGAVLHLISNRELAAITSPVEPGALATTKHVFQHERTLEAVRETVPALPVRFGTILPDDASVVAALEDGYDSLIADLDRLGDKVEMGVTAVAAAAPSPPAPADAAAAAGGPGSRYLRARVEEYRREESDRRAAEQMGRDLDRVLIPPALERRRLADREPARLRAGYLIDPASVPIFRERVERFRLSRPDLRVVLTGPWPPYTFVSKRGAQRTEGRT